MRKNWTKEEIEYLKQHYVIDGRTKCAVNLNRTKRSVEKKAACLGLKRFVPYQDPNFKICTKCKTLRKIEEFLIKNKKTGTRACRCKPCEKIRHAREHIINREENIKRCKIYYQNHKEASLKSSKTWAKNNPERRKEIVNKSYHKNKEKHYIKRKKYKQDNKLKINEYNTQRRKTDLNYKMKGILRHRLYMAVNGKSKKGSAVRDLGCSIEFFLQYIQERFKPAMSWDNWGEIWQIDHIIPLASFNLANRDELLRACHYTNQQPLWRTTRIARQHGDMISIGNTEKSDKLLICATEPTI